MYNVYLTDREGNNEFHLRDYEKREEALLYILMSLEIVCAAQSIVFTSSSNVVKVFNGRGLHYANYVIKEEL